MFAWLKNSYSAWADRFLKHEIERLHAESVRLKAEVLAATGEERIRLPPEARKKLDQLRNDLDPEVLRRIDVLSDAE
jgi:hypothetical protein